MSDTGTTMSSSVQFMCLRPPCVTGWMPMSGVKRPGAENASVTQRVTRHESLRGGRDRGQRSDPRDASLAGGWRRLGGGPGLDGGGRPDGAVAERDERCREGRVGPLDQGELGRGQPKLAGDLL